MQVWTCKVLSQKPFRGICTLSSKQSWGLLKWFELFPKGTEALPVHCNLYPAKKKAANFINRSTLHSVQKDLTLWGLIWWFISLSKTRFVLSPKEAEPLYFFQKELTDLYFSLQVAVSYRMAFVEICKWTTLWTWKYMPNLALNQYLVCFYFLKTKLPLASSTNEQL